MYKQKDLYFNIFLYPIKIAVYGLNKDLQYVSIFCFFDHYFLKKYFNQ